MAGAARSRYCTDKHEQRLSPPGNGVKISAGGLRILPCRHDMEMGL